MNLLISACLIGVRCRYDGGCKSIDCLNRLNERFTLIPICPEVMGGLPTPRIPAERVGARVMMDNGRNVTEAFQQGAECALSVARATNCTLALLKERSPSCGCGHIYDGTFTGSTCEGNGVTADLFLQNGIRIFGESQAEELLRLPQEERKP